MNQTPLDDRRRRLLETHRRTIGFTGAAAAIALAGLWLVVVPDRAAEADGLRELAMRYGHSLCWALLAVAAILYALDAPRRSITAVAWSGLAAYAGFVVATFF